MQFRNSNSASRSEADFFFPGDGDSTATGVRWASQNSDRHFLVPFAPCERESLTTISPSDNGGEDLAGGRGPFHDLLFRLCVDASRFVLDDTSTSTVVLCTSHSACVDAAPSRMGGTCAAMLNREIFLTELLSSFASPPELASEVAMELASTGNGQKRDPYPPFLFLSQPEGPPTSQCSTLPRPSFDRALNPHLNLQKPASLPVRHLVLPSSLPPTAAGQV